MELFYVFGFLVLWFLLFMNKKITEVIIIQNIGVIALREHYFTKVWREVEGVEPEPNQLLFNKIRKDDMFLVLKKKAWNPINSLLPFSYGFLPSSFRKFISVWDHYIKRNRHHAFVIATEASFKKEISKIQKENEEIVKAYMKSVLSMNSDDR